jgi:hypothetical protein
VSIDCARFYREELWSEAARPRLVALYNEMIDAVERRDRESLAATGTS